MCNRQGEAKGRLVCCVLSRRGKQRRPRAAAWEDYKACVWRRVQVPACVGCGVGECECMRAAILLRSCDDFAAMIIRLGTLECMHKNTSASHTQPPLQHKYASCKAWSVPACEAGLGLESDSHKQHSHRCTPARRASIQPYLPAVPP